jgi:hypothetical protein
MSIKRVLSVEALQGALDATTAAVSAANSAASSANSAASTANNAADGADDAAIAANAAAASVGDVLLRQIGDLDFAIIDHRKRVIDDGGGIDALRVMSDEYIEDDASFDFQGTAHKAAKAYAIKPESGAGDLTVSRNSGQAYIDQRGVLRFMANNVLRPTFGTGADRGKLKGTEFPPGATNLALRSEEFDNAYWGKASGGTGSVPVVTANNAIAPDGTMTADLIYFNRGAGNTVNDNSQLASSVFATISGLNYTGSIWLKAATPSDVGKQLAFRGVANVAYGVVTITSDWVRYERTETETDTSGAFQLASRGTFSNGNEVSVHIWGAQVETGSVATSYIKTEGATASRADLIVSDTSAAAEIGQTQGTIEALVDVRILPGSGESVIWRGYIDDDNEIILSRVRGTNNQFKFFVESSGVEQASIVGGNIAAGVRHIVAVYGEDDFRMYVDGVLYGTADTSGTVPACDKHAIGSNGVGNFLNDTLKRLRLYKTKKTQQWVEARYAQISA